MSADVRWRGLEELIQQLTDAPKTIREQGMQIVREETDGAATEVALRYPSRSGTLARLVRAEYPSSTVLVGRVRSGARHSHLFEFGTGPRKAGSGANRGTMPAAGILVPIVERRRQRMYERLAEMLRQMGYTVTP